MTRHEDLNPPAKPLGSESAPDALTPAPVIGTDNLQTLETREVRIDRGRDQLQIFVPEHEIPILKVVHGEFNVNEVEDGETDTAEFTKDADIEFRRLQAKYRRVNAPDPVLIAYPTGAKSLDGFTLGRGARTQAPQSVAVDHGKAARKAAAAKR